MKVIVDMENLQEIVENAIPKNIETAVQKAIDDVVASYVNENCQETIEEIVQSYMETYVKDYIHNTKITVGGGLFDDGEAKEYTVENYIKSQLAEMLENECLIIKKEDRWGDIKKEKISFVDFIKNEFDPTSYLQIQLKEFAQQLKKDTNERIEATFNEATRTALSDAMYNVLMSNDTYKQLQKSIMQLTDGEG